jgi:hypothetical protein
MVKTLHMLGDTGEGIDKLFQAGDHCVVQQCVVTGYAQALSETCECVALTRYLVTDFFRYPKIIKDVCKQRPQGANGLFSSKIVDGFNGDIIDFTETFWM